MIYQKKSPKSCFTARLTNENYDFLCRIAGELSLAAALNEVVKKAKESGITFCNSKRPDHTIGAEYHAR
jgi:hypothetical protein